MNQDVKFPKIDCSADHNNFKKEFNTLLYQMLDKMQFKRISITKIVKDPFFEYLRSN